MTENIGRVFTGQVAGGEFATAPHDVLPFVDTIFLDLPPAGRRALRVTYGFPEPGGAGFVMHARPDDFSRLDQGLFAIGRQVFS